MYYVIIILQLRPPNYFDDSDSVAVLLLAPALARSVGERYHHTVPSPAHQPKSRPGSVARFRRDPTGDSAVAHASLHNAHVCNNNIAYPYVLKATQRNVTE